MKYQFVKIPKTGSTAFYSCLSANYPEVFVETMYENQPPHELKANSCPSPIVIVREPVERIVSIYRYWLSGSEMFNDVKREMSFSEFLDSINIFNIWTSYTWVEHILPQIRWIPPEAHHKTIVIKYKNDLTGSMNLLLGYLNLPPIATVPKINISNNKEEIEIFEKDLIKIRERYSQDFLLWEEIKQCSNRFNAVID